MWDYSATFGAGARVKVIRQREYPEYKLLNLIGTVRSDSGTNVSVVLDNVTNPRSQYGCFYFKAVDLVEAIDETNIMEEKNMSKSIAITNYLNVVKISPVGNSNVIYNYANFYPDLTEGDLCVVTGLTDVREATSSTLRGMTVAKVIEVIDKNDIEVSGEVVTKIATDAYDERVRCRIKAVELKNKMEARAKQLRTLRCIRCWPRMILTWRHFCMSIRVSVKFNCHETNNQQERHRILRHGYSIFSSYYSSYETGWI